MEQLLAPLTLVDRTGTRDVRPDQPVQADIGGDVQQAWARLTEITLDPHILHRNTIVGHKPVSEVDILRTRCLQHMRTKNLVRLGITAPGAGCGKTTVAANLAMATARHSELKTLVFDFDLRNPDMINKLGLKDRGPRFSALEYDRRHFYSSCLRVGENLGFSLNATAPDSPSELLGAQQTRVLIDEIQADFEPDLMIFNLPPALGSDDAMNALGMMDAALIVAGADHSTIDQIDETERQIAEQTQCLGVVLNRCRFSS